MVKEDKTIDGFAVRRAKDSTLVARSKANKLSANKTTTKRSMKAASENDPLVRKASRGTTTRKTRAPRRVSQAKLFTAEPKAFDLKVESPIHDYDEDDDGARYVEKIEYDVNDNEEAHEEFLAPVESFGNEDSNDSTDEGIISDVDDEEVKDMKKSKKELRENEKKAKLERKRLAKAEKHQAKKKKSKVGRFFKWFFIILLILAIGLGVYVYFWGDGILKKITGGKGDIWSAIGAVTSEKYEPLKTDENGRTNILVFGTSGFDMTGTGFDDYEHDGSQLTDSIMVVSLDQEAGDVAIVSLPRDLYAGYTCTATSKINEVYWCNNMYGDNEDAGAEALQGKIKEILGIDTQYYVHMNWGALVSIINALGKVTITLDEDINDYDYTGAVYEAGVEYEIDGYDALALSRARHGTGYGDFSRAASQQKILIGIKDKVVEKGLGIGEAVSIISAVGDNLRMNLTMPEIKTGMHLLETFDLDSIRQIPLWDDNTQYMTFGNENGISYIVPVGGIGNYGPIQQYISQQLKSNPTQREGAVIIVYNGTGESGVAANEKAALEERGYEVQEIANAPEGEYKYTEDIELYDASEGTKPESKEALERFYGVDAKDMDDLPNGISPVGYDFIIIVGSATNATSEE